jgi:hypothetical protein
MLMSFSGAYAYWAEERGWHPLSSALATGYCFYSYRSRLLYGLLLRLTFLGGYLRLLLRLLYWLVRLAGLTWLRWQGLTWLVGLVRLAGLTLLVRWPGLAWLVGLARLIRLIRWWVLLIRGRKNCAAHAAHDRSSQGSQNDGNSYGEKNPRPEANREAKSKAEKPDKALEAAVGRSMIIGANRADQRSKCQANKQDGQKPVSTDATQENGHGQTNDKNPGSDAAYWISVRFSIRFLVVHDLFLLLEW